jgi:hypothetical protein
MNVIKEFNDLLSQSKHLEIINLLKDYRVSEQLSVDELGWVYWNISDCYAILRQPKPLYENHKEFFMWGKQHLLPDKLHWIVSDSTQALTLSLGNHFDEWLDWYNYACEYTPKLASNRAVRFESHRTLIGSLLVLDRFTGIDLALQNLYQLIQEDEKWINSLFSKIIYYKLLLARLYKSKDSSRLASTLKELKSITEILKYGAFDIIQEEFILGSWEQLNTPRNSQKAILVALNNLACTYTDIKKHQESAELFDFIQERGHQLNSYGFSKFLLSIWITRGIEDAKNLLKNSSFKLSDLCKHSSALAGIGF